MQKPPDDLHEQPDDLHEQPDDLHEQPDDLHEQPDDLHEQPGKGNDQSDLIKWLPIKMQRCAHSQSCKAACRTKCSILLSIHF